MRYFVVEYLQQKDGKYNERASVQKQIKPNMMQRAMVILDFKDRKIVKLRAETGVGERNFDRISEFYKGNGYDKVIGQIEAGYEIIKEVEELAKENSDGC